MKTKIFKSVMPLMAFLMAIGLAFASSITTEKIDQTLITGWINQSGMCQSVQVDCQLIGAQFCEIGNDKKIVHRDSTCVSPLFKRL